MRGLSQRALAKTVGTSQQQIQRIETGIQTVRIDLAIRIANALSSSLPEIFPKLATQAREPRRRRSLKTASLSRAIFQAAGIQTDPRQWTIRIGFQGDREFDFPISAAEKKRLWSIASNEKPGFLVFNSDTKCVAANQSRINYTHFLFDPSSVKHEQEKDYQHDVVVHFVGNNEPAKFGVYPDYQDIVDDNSGSGSQLQRMLIELDANEADDEVVFFDDEDTERVFLRTRQLLLVEVPLVCCEPALWKNGIDNLGNDEVDARTAQAGLGTASESKPR